MTNLHKALSDCESKSPVKFQAGLSSVSISDVSHLTVLASSAGRDWTGLHLEVGFTQCWNGEDLMVDGHFVCMHPGPDPLVTEFRDEDGTWVPCVREPGSFWLHPEGTPYSLRIHRPASWTGAIVDGKVLDTLLGGHITLRPGFNVVDPLLEHLFRALIEEVRHPSLEADVPRALIDAFLIALGRRHGIQTAIKSTSPALTKQAIAELSKWILKRTEERISVADLAKQVGLSTAPFSREFKLVTGRTPWEHVIALRLERACELLQHGVAATEVALQCGFFDQAHFSRAFKKQHQMSPSTFARRARIHVTEATRRATLNQG